MNYYELNALIAQLELEQEVGIDNTNLLEFYYKKRIELLDEINRKLKEVLN